MHKSRVIDEILDVFSRHNELCDQDLADFTKGNINPNSIRSSRIKLEEKGFITKTEKRLNTNATRECMHYKITKKGLSKNKPIKKIGRPSKCNPQDVIAAYNKVGRVKGWGNIISKMFDVSAASIYACVAKYGKDIPKQKINKKELCFQVFARMEY